MNDNIDIEIMEYLSHNVLYLRKKHNITKRKMAKILGVGIKTLNKVEKGILPPRLSVEFLFRIKENFGTSLKNQISVKIDEPIEKIF